MINCVYCIDRHQCVQYLLLICYLSILSIFVTYQFKSVLLISISISPQCGQGPKTTTKKNLIARSDRPLNLIARSDRRNPAIILRKNHAIILRKNLTATRRNTILMIQPLLAVLLRAHWQTLCHHRRTKSAPKSE